MTSKVTKPENTAKKPLVGPLVQVNCWDCNVSFQHKSRTRHYNNFCNCTSKAYWCPGYVKKTNLFASTRENKTSQNQNTSEEVPTVMDEDTQTIDQGQPTEKKDLNVGNLLNNTTSASTQSEKIPKKRYRQMNLFETSGQLKLVEKEVQKLIEAVKAKSGEESEQIEFLQEIKNSTKRLHELEQNLLHEVKRQKTKQKKLDETFAPL